jgi:ubiquinone/menaquinone biosynthesis C-methylase UbiE
VLQQQIPAGRVLVLARCAPASEATTKYQPARDPRHLLAESSSTIAAVNRADARSREMRRFWNARAREDAFYFVDNRRRYKSPDVERFWDADEAVQHMLHGLGVELRPNDIVLEIGCGIGRITRALAAHAREVIAIDISDEMLSRARALNPRISNVRWMLGDGRTLAGVEDASVDACVSIVTLQHVPDPSITMGYVRELGRVLRSNGWAALQVSNDPEVHRASAPLAWRAKALLGLAPKGQRHPAWLGSYVELDALQRTADQSRLTVEKVWGRGSQYCQVLLRKIFP